jgi:hypothetical protein
MHYGREEGLRSAARWDQNPEKEYESEGWGTASFLIIRRLRGAVGVEEVLQNQHCGDLVDDLAMAGKRTSGGVEVTVSLSGREALVPEMDWKGKGFTKGLGESVGFCCLGAEVAGHIEGVSQDDGRAAKSAKEAAERPEVLFRISADEGEDGLGGETKLVGDSHTDAAVSEIEAQEAGLHSSHVSSGRERKPHLTMG